MPADNDLHKAAHKGDIDACKMLIEGSVGEDVPITVNDLGASDRRPLHRAAGAGHLEICKYFLDIGAEIDAVSNSKNILKFQHSYSKQVDKSGRTALHWAAISGHTEIVQLLLGKGANILAETTSKSTSLHCAVEANRVETVRCLMQHVSDNEQLKTSLTMAKNNEDKTAWDVSVSLEKIFYIITLS